MKAPSSKDQAPENLQVPNTKARSTARGSWNLGLFWSLVRGAWCFDFAMPEPAPL